MRVLYEDIRLRDELSNAGYGGRNPEEIKGDARARSRDYIRDRARLAPHTVRCVVCACAHEYMNLIYTHLQSNTCIQIVQDTDEISKFRSGYIPICFIYRDGQGFLFMCAPERARLRVKVCINGYVDLLTGQMNEKIYIGLIYRLCRRAAFQDFEYTSSSRGYHCSIYCNGDIILWK